MSKKKNNNNSKNGFVYEIPKEGFRKWGYECVKRDSEIIVEIQKKYRTPFLDVFFKYIAKLADEEMFTYGLPLAGWNISYDVVQIVMFLWVLLFYTGHFTKDFVKLPRPALVNNKIVALETHFSLEYGMPSTHVQAAISLPMFFLYLWFQRYGTFFSTNFFFSLGLIIIYILLIAASRIYLGVHSFFDIAFGAIFGIICLIISIFLAEPTWLFVKSGGWLHAIVVLVLSILLYPRPKHFSTTYRDTTAIIAVMVGVIIGFEMTKYITFFQILPSIPVVYNNTIYGVLKRSIVGISFLFVCHESSKSFFWLVLSRLHSKYLSKYFPPQSANDNYNRKTEQRYSIVIPHKFLSYIVIGCINTSIVPVFFYRLQVVPNGWEKIVWF